VKKQELLFYNITTKNKFAKVASPYKKFKEDDLQGRNTFPPGELQIVGDSARGH
jgi:hypothetical protein